MQVSVSADAPAAERESRKTRKRRDISLYLGTACPVYFMMVPPCAARRIGTSYYSGSCNMCRMPVGCFAEKTLLLADADEMLRMHPKPLQFALFGRADLSYNEASNRIGSVHTGRSDIRMNQRMEFLRQFQWEKRHHAARITLDADMPLPYRDASLPDAMRTALRLKLALEMVQKHTFVQPVHIIFYNPNGEYIH